MGCFSAVGSAFNGVGRFSQPATNSIYTHSLVRLHFVLTTCVHRLRERL